uniref:Uncharacterized protein n=1 Tax=Setaria italica TaxID=4555 RepID=K4AKB0_SETIT
VPSDVRRDGEEGPVVSHGVVHAQVRPAALRPPPPVDVAARRQGHVLLEEPSGGARHEGRQVAPREEASLSPDYTQDAGGHGGGVGASGDTVDEVRAQDLAPEQLACGGAPEDGGGIGARGDLEQEVRRKLRSRRGRAPRSACSAAFARRHRFTPDGTLGFEPR